MSAPDEIRGASTSTVGLRNRVPHIIILYWIIKIAATTLGETGADMFSMTFSLGYGMTIGIFLLVSLAFGVIKLALKRYNPTSYWLLFTSTAILGTAISDFIDRTLGLGYVVGSLVLTVLLLIVLALWHRREKSLSVERITSSRVEIYYWVAFLVANTLGTAAGDCLADDFGLGFSHSAILLGCLLAVAGALHYFTRTSTVILFWFAFVLTRPFGAAFGDLLTKSKADGGLGFGTVAASLFFAVILVLALIKETQMERTRYGNPA
ncbi:MAG: hypothetical protein R3E97_01925 [Candidatus Eisenbacteria bacterium]